MGNNEIINQVYSADLGELWEIFKKEVEVTDALFIKVRNGIDLKFDIISYLNRWDVRVKEKANSVGIGGKWFKKEDVDTELIKREKLMSEHLLEKFTNSPLARPRQ